MTESLLKTGQMLVFEGDSLTRRESNPCVDTWAFARLNNWDHSFSEIAEEWILVNIPHMRLRVRHAAIGGSRITTIAERYETKVKPLKPDWIILTTGSNDSRRGGTVEEFEADLARYVDTAQRDSGARFLFAGGLQPMPGATDEVRVSLEKAEPYYEATRRVIRASGGLTPPIGCAMLRQAEALFSLSSYHTFYADNTHLNALGHQVLASVVLRALGAYQLVQPLEV